MRARRILLVALILLISLSGVASAQMDMLPQIFRDLPPELQQGLPQDMTYEEYRELTRNVDFFTMFMSMWVPGYGLFQVERPEFAWAVVGARAVGYGLMGAAVYRQWDDIRDLGRLSSLSNGQYREFLTNALLFSGGVFLNGMGWAADVLGAYHIAKWEKDFVIYKYGLQDGLKSGNAERERIEYIRKLVLQDGRYVEEDLLRELKRYVAEHPKGRYRAEVEYYLGTAYTGLEQPARALLHFSRSFLFYPDSRFASSSRREAIRLIHSYREAWRRDWSRLVTVTERGSELTRGSDEERFSRYLEEFARLETPVFQDLFIEEAVRFSLRYRSEGFADDALQAAATQLQRTERYEHAVMLLTELAGRFPDSPHAPEALFDVGVLLTEELGAAEYAEPFFSRLIERQPDSELAERAQNRLQDLRELQ